MPERTQTPPAAKLSADDLAAALAPHSSSPTGKSLSVTGLRKSYAGTTVVDGVDMEIAAGEFVTFLGSSGSGKTTTLMMLAGFTEPDSGSVAVDGHDVTGLNPAKRDFGFVFQQYLLFPHMTVTENVAFPLQLRGVDKAEIRRRVGETLEAAGLSKFAGRKPRELSGGQQQRVALCRVLVYRPPIVLMDEPLGALDKRLRDQMQTEIKSIQRELGLTVVYVTHDQEEALVLSDRIAIMKDGRIEQFDTPAACSNAPAPRSWPTSWAPPTSSPARSRTVERTTAPRYGWTPAVCSRPAPTPACPDRACAPRYGRASCAWSVPRRAAVPAPSRRPSTSAHSPGSPFAWTVPLRERRRCGSRPPLYRRARASGCVSPPTGTTSASSTPRTGDEPWPAPLSHPPRRG